MAAASVTCRAFIVVRLEITRPLSVASLTAPRRFRNETWCRRWWNISQRSLSTTTRKFAPALSPLLNREAREFKEPRSSQKITKEAKSTKELPQPDSSTLTEVSVDFHRGFPRITVPLPSRKERCIFTLKPITHTVGDFLNMLKSEDRGIDRAVITTIDGTRIGGCNTIESLLNDDFKLIVNDATYDVTPPLQDNYSMETIDKLSDVQIAVCQLYETLHCQEYNSILERETVAELEQVMLELEPLEAKKLELETTAERRANFHAFVGLMAMGVQVGILARLTWWEYSWDIMEPVTYFVTYATGMACYVYFIMTRQEFMLPDVMNRRYLMVFHKRAKAIGLDLTIYNQLRERAYELETTLKIIRGPLWNHKHRIQQKIRERGRSSSSSSSSSSESRSRSRSTSPSLHSSDKNDEKVHNKTVKS
ncbi:calcium uniporter protein, mitochondrial isoform X2 [Fopius arisanus]|uniref:Calcium uniporter protein n=1 Tax=Fopius arisanus TaxID=64838 RepID=A0A0C9REZ7_9HYME|nr:PREDICTED: calcium uniporter protein, mitochondrial isoform X2 [Fopius arisanus]